ncbi:MAG: hypothetical protein ACTH2Y_08335 [Corynebacterium sp.]|uniref:hypothetical protein n=1 Tax=Corynebacterium TaxID=1716 RepID=UPI003F918F2B
MSTPPPRQTPSVQLPVVEDGAGWDWQNDDYPESWRSTDRSRTHLYPNFTTGTEYPSNWT